MTHFRNLSVMNTVYSVALSSKLCGARHLHFHISVQSTLIYKDPDNPNLAFIGTFSGSPNGACTIQIPLINTDLALT